MIIALAPFPPADAVAVASYSRDRINGRVDANGTGYIVEAFPYGGSVIASVGDRYDGS